MKEDCQSVLRLEHPGQSAKWPLLGEPLIYGSTADHLIALWRCTLSNSPALVRCAGGALRVHYPPHFENRAPSSDNKSCARI